MIGAFVLGAVLLGVAGVVVLSGDRLFRDTQTVVAYFDGSLEGLDIGAPVTFNGVKIGSVTDLKVVIDPRDESIRTPVFFRIDAHHLHDAGGGRITFKQESRRLEVLIEHGLRARLELQSLVTGQLVVALNFYPSTSVRLRGWSKRYPEMPTIPSSFDTLTRRVENLPIEALVTETIGTMQSVKALVTAPEVKSGARQARPGAQRLRGSRADRERPDRSAHDGLARDDGRDAHDDGGGAGRARTADPGRRRRHRGVPGARAGCAEGRGERRRADRAPRGLHREGGRRGRRDNWPTLAACSARIRRCATSSRSRCRRSRRRQGPCAPSPTISTGIRKRSWFGKRPERPR